MNIEREIKCKKSLFMYVHNIYDNKVLNDIINVIHERHIFNKIVI